MFPILKQLQIQTCKRESLSLSVCSWLLRISDLLEILDLTSASCCLSDAMSSAVISRSFWSSSSHCVYISTSLAYGYARHMMHLNISNSSSSFCRSSLATWRSVAILLILLFWASATRLLARLERMMVCSMEKKITPVDNRIRPTRI